MKRVPRSLMGKSVEIVNDQVVDNIGGGFSRFLGDFLGISAKDRRILFVMTGPVDVSVPFTQPSRERGHCQWHRPIPNPNSSQ